MNLSFRALVVPLLAGLGLAAGGCGSEERIASYSVPKATERGDARSETSEYRLLGAMYPADNPVWFFKFSGPAASITKYEADFDKLIASVSTGNASKPDFTPPEGWKRGPGRGGVVVETVLPPEAKLEVTITQSAGGVEGNLERWVKMIGLPPGPTDVEQFTKPIAAKDVKGVRVDLRGPKDPATSRGSMMGGR